MKNIITAQEISKLAKLSLIKLGDKDAELMTKEIGCIVVYISRLENLTLPDNIQNLPHNINVDRKDIIISTDADKILACAPKLEERYFEVPVIINH